MKENDRIGTLIAELRGYRQLKEEYRSLQMEIAAAETCSYGVGSYTGRHGTGPGQGVDRIAWLMRKERLQDQAAEKRRQLAGTEDKIRRIRSSADGVLLYRVYVEKESMSAVAREYGILPGSLYRRLRRELKLLFFG